MKVPSYLTFEASYVNHLHHTSKLFTTPGQRLSSIFHDEHLAQEEHQDGNPKVLALCALGAAMAYTRRIF